MLFTISEKKLRKIVLRDFLHIFQSTFRFPRKLEISREFPLSPHNVSWYHTYAINQVINRMISFRDFPTRTENRWKTLLSRNREKEVDPTRSRLSEFLSTFPEFSYVLAAFESVFHHFQDNFLNSFPFTILSLWTHENFSES